MFQLSDRRRNLRQAESREQIFFGPSGGPRYFEWLPS
jgi:hypothetical protein